MNLISSDEFKTICYQSNYTLLKLSENRPKILETPDGTIVKVFYPRKKLYSSSTLKPYAVRFCQNANRLRELGFNAPIINSIQHCPQLNIYVVNYQKLQGTDIRGIARRNHDILYRIAAYMADLHNRGVFFRAIHLENLLQQNDKHFALIDIADVRFRKKPLSIYMRYRNLKHLFQNREDRALWGKFGIKQFLNSYFQHTSLSSISKAWLSILAKK